MADWLLWINLNTILSNLIGGGIALLVALYVSRRDSSRRQEQRRENWYRSIHRQLRMVRAFPQEMPEKVARPGEEPVRARFEVVSTALKEQMAESPRDLHPQIHKYLGKTTWHLDRFVIDVKDPIDDEFEEHKKSIKYSTDNVYRYSLITLYLIEQSTDIEFQRPLTNTEKEEAREKYERWADTDKDLIHENEN